MLADFIKEGASVVTRYGVWEPREQTIEMVHDDGYHIKVYFTPKGEFEDEQKRYVAMSRNSALYHSNGQHAAGPMIFESWDDYKVACERSERLAQIIGLVSRLSDSDQTALVAQLEASNG